jgi:hypothetical protein
MEERMKIINNIVEITDDIKEHVDIQDIKLEFTCNKYSSKKNNIYHVILNGIQLTKRNKYYIKYKCLTCSSLHIVGTTQFLRKVNKCSHRCYLCCNKDENNQHKEFFESYVAPSPEVKHKSLIDLKEESINLFHTYDDDFKDNYFKNHLTEDDYKRLSKNLKSLQNGKHIIDDDNLQYWPIFKTNNQMLFSSVFYDKINDMIVRAHQPIMQCDNCNKIWRAKTIEKFKNCYKILCQDCTFCNKTFKIRNTKNNINEPILYQSQLELKFINWCKNNNITVVNGPTIVYDFEGKQKKYKVAFRIGSILIEIKDNHIWHKRQLESGVWNAKEDAVHNEKKKGLYKEYHIITPRNWMLELKSLLNKI